MWMNSSEVLEAVLLSKASDSSTAATAPIAFTVFDGRQEVIRALLQKANYERIGRTLMNFIRCDRQDDEAEFQRVTLVESDDKHDSFPYRNKIISSVDEEFLSRLRAHLLRIRVARQLGQDFLVSKQMVELQTLCREDCPHSNGLETNVFRRLWGMLEQKQARPTSSLSEDAAVVSKARNILQQAVVEGDKDGEGEEEKGSNHTVNPSKEFTHRPSSAIDPSPADALPLLVLAEVLSAWIVVNACLDFIRNNQKEVIGVARILFDPAFDWASAVTRLAKWPRVAETSPSPPPPTSPPSRTRQLSFEFPQGKMTEAVREHGQGALGPPFSFAESGSKYEREHEKGVLLREGICPSSWVGRGQLVGREKKDQSSTVKNVGIVNENSSSDATDARVAQEAMVPETISGQCRGRKDLELETWLQPGDTLHNVSIEEASWRPQPAASPASSQTLSASLPQYQSLQEADCSGKEAMRICEIRRRESRSCTLDCSWRSGGCHRRYPARVRHLESLLGNLLLGKTRGDRELSYLESDGEDQRVQEEGELDADDAALGLNDRLLKNHRRNNPEDLAGQISRVHVRGASPCNEQSSTSLPVSETASSSKESSGMTLVTPTPTYCVVVPFACESPVLREKRASHRTSVMCHSPANRKVTSHPPPSRNVEAYSTRKTSIETGFPGSNVDSFASAAEREYESSCALARKRALLRVRLARQRSMLAAVEANASEQGFRAERRRRREGKVARFLQRTSERAIHGSRHLEIRSRVVQHNSSGDDGGEGEGEPVAHQGYSRPRDRVSFALHSGRRSRPGKPPAPNTKASIPSPLLSTAGTHVARDHRATDGSEDKEEMPRRPLDVKPAKPGTRSGWRVGSVYNSCSGRTSAKTPVAQQTTASRHNEHHVTSPNFKRTFTASFALVVRIDALFSLPGGGSSLYNGCDGVSEGSDHPNVEACACSSTYLLLEAGRLKHRTAAQRPECCKLGTCRATNCRRESSSRQSRADAISRADAKSTNYGTWVFGETAVLRFVPKGSSGRWSPPENLRILVYSCAGGDHQSYEIDSCSTRDRHLVCDTISLGAARWTLVGLATLPLRGQLAGDLNDGFRERADGECTFSRSLEISVAYAENGLPIGWVKVGVCAE